MVLADKIYLTPIFQFANISFLSTSSNLCRLKLFSDSSALKKDPPTQFVSESLKKYLTNNKMYDIMNKLLGDSENELNIEN